MFHGNKMANNLKKINLNNFPALKIALGNLSEMLRDSAVIQVRVSDAYEDVKRAQRVAQIPSVLWKFNELGELSVFETVGSFSPTDLQAINEENNRNLQKYAWKKVSAEGLK